MLVGDYLSVKEQINTINIPDSQKENIQALIGYENSVLKVTKDLWELLFAYPLEEDTGIYVVVANGKFCASNNRRAISSYTEKFENLSNMNILVHKLGANIDFDLSHKLRTVEVF